MLNPNHIISKDLTSAMFERSIDRVTDALTSSFGPGRFLVIIDQDDHDPLLVSIGDVVAERAVEIMTRVSNAIHNDLASHRTDILSSPIYRLRRNVPEIRRGAGDLARVLKTDQSGVHVAFEDQMDRTYIFEDLGPLEPVQTLTEAGRLTRVELLTDFAEFKSGAAGRIAFEGALAYENPPVIFDEKPGICIGVPAASLRAMA